jgi:hypothetical protein
MRSIAAVATFVAAANAMAYNYTAPPVYETTVVSEYTTVCPGPTEIPIGPGKTITVTEATTLTITDCPCTVSKPVYTPAPSEAPSKGPSKVPTTPIYTPPVVPGSSAVPYYPSGNASVPVVPAPTGTPPPSVPSGTSTPKPSEFPGAAGKAGLSLLAVAGALAAFL